MSEIPYVNRLGDALDVAIARPAPARRWPRLTRRRYLVVALAALVVVGGGGAIAGMLNDPVEIGFGAVGCFEGTEPSGDVAIITDPTRSPVELCASALPNRGLEARDLIACQWPGHGVVVVARGDRGSCTQRGLAPVPAQYAAARERAVRLERIVTEFERQVDCLAPRRFARRLEAAVRARGFAGWTAVVRGAEGPCGRVSSSGGSAARSIAGYVDGARRTIAVRGAAPPALERMLWGAGSPGDDLFRASGARCFTLAALKARIASTLAPAGYPVRFRLGSLAPYEGLAGARGARYREGCAVIAGVQPEFPGGRIVIVADLLQRGPRG